MMQTIYQNSHEKSHVDVFEERIHEIRFSDFDYANTEFDEWTYQILWMFRTVQDRRILLEMGDLCIKESSTHRAPPSRIFRVKQPDGLFWYVDVIPIIRQFLFIADKEHTQSMAPDEGIVRMIHRQTGLDAQFIKIRFWRLVDLSALVETLL